MHVLKYAQNRSTYTTPQDLVFPSRGSDISQTPWSGYGEWATLLARKGYHWQAINAVKILASTTTPDWSIKVYSGLNSIISALHASTFVDVSRIALQVALGRRFLTISAKDKATENIKEADRLLSIIENQIGRSCLRQRLELAMANLELQSSALDAQTCIQRWHLVSITAQETMEWGIESTCLTECVQIAAKNHMDSEMQKHATRLQIVEQDFERDVQSVLSNRCGLWRPGNRQNLGELLRWFDDHDKEYPLSGFLTGNPKEGDLQKWDIPDLSARMAQLRYLIYSELGDSQRARLSQSIAAQIYKLVPWFRVIDMGLADRYAMEWLDPLSIGSCTPFEVLIRRIKIRYQNRILNDTSDWYRYRELNEAQMRNLVLCFPFDAHQFESRIATLQHWFDKDDTLDQCSSHYLVARLYLEHYEHAKTTGQGPKILENLVRRFDTFVKSLPESSRTVQQSLQANVLLSWQELYDQMLRNPSIGPAQLQFLQGRYQDLVTQYEESHLAKNLPIIGSLYGRIAETGFRLATSENELHQAMRSLEHALVYYGNYRSSISVLEGLPALELKASIRTGIVGDQEVLHRAMSALMAKWVIRDIPDGFKSCVTNLMWPIVQHTKNRALNDALSSSKVLSAGDKATIGANPQSAECLRDWQDALEALCRALQIRHPKASEIAHAREMVRIQEQKMLADPLCMEVIALSKGIPPSSNDISKLFSGSKEHVILVDWFTADVPVAPDKLFMITLQVCPEPKPPQIHNLELGLARKISDWNSKYLIAPNAANNRKSQGAYNDLKQLAGLVEPLANISQPNDVLVFCPTTKWNLHRVPLHAIELPPSNRRAFEQQDAVENLLVLRNRLVYTYSQSMLRLTIVSRQNEPPRDSWHASVLSPLASSKSANEVTSISDLNINPIANKNSKTIEGRDILKRISALSRFLSSNTSTCTLLTSTAVTKSACVHAMPKTSFFVFLGHVHPARQAINSHILLFDPEPKSLCTGHETEPETYLSVKEIITGTSLQQGAHVILLACGSGVTDARVQDEALGLVPGLFHAGARSVVATLWDTNAQTACTWLQSMQYTWEDTERKMRAEERATNKTLQMIDLADLFRSCARKLINRDGRGQIDSWAPFMYNGYWMYPKRNVQVWDSDEEDA